MQQWVICLVRICDVSERPWGVKESVNFATQKRRFVSFRLKTRGDSGRSFFFIVNDNECLHTAMHKDPLARVSIHGLLFSWKGQEVMGWHEFLRIPKDVNTHLALHVCLCFQLKRTERLNRKTHGSSLETFTSVRARFQNSGKRDLFCCSVQESLSQSVSPLHNLDFISHNLTLSTLSWI